MYSNFAQKGFLFLLIGGRVSKRFFFFVYEHLLPASGCLGRLRKEEEKKDSNPQFTCSSDMA
jgi:hypothetical protein